MIKLDNRQLKIIEKIFKENKLKVRVGILGDGSMRKEGLTNAEIGAEHEFGTEIMPRRSFLRMPLSMKLTDTVKKSKAFDKDSIKQVYADRSLKTLMKKIGIIAETIIQDAFATGGFGLWKPSDMRFKKNHQTLVETQQLRNSITSEVVE